MHRYSSSTCRQGSCFLQLRRRRENSVTDTVERGNEAVVNVLIDNGIDTSTVNRRRFTLVHYSAEIGCRRVTTLN